MQESLFEPPTPKPSKKDVEKEAEVTLDLFNNYLPSSLRRMLGEKEVRKRSKILISALQHPVMNKQLGLTLVEILLAKIFPELKL